MLFLAKDINLKWSSTLDILFFKLALGQIFEVDTRHSDPLSRALRIPTCGVQNWLVGCKSQTGMRTKNLRTILTLTTTFRDSDHSLYGLGPEPLQTCTRVMLKIIKPKCGKMVMKHEKWTPTLMPRLHFFWWGPQLPEQNGIYQCAKCMVSFQRSPNRLSRKNAQYSVKHARVE